MNRTRSISYAPHSIGAGRKAREVSRRCAEWTLCRKFEQFPIADDATLRLWTERGRVRPDDYLVSRQLDLCVQARDIAELGAMFRQNAARRLARVCLGLACAALAAVWVVPVVSAVMVLSALAAAVLCCRSASGRQAI